MSAVENITKKAAEITKRMEEATKAMRLEAQATFGEGCKALFVELPALESFGWKQYTPHFNDGDECVFGANVDEPDINGIDGYEVGYGDNVALVEVQKQVATFLSAFPSDALKTIFGDHMQIVVNRDGAQATEYEHD